MFRLLRWWRKSLELLQEDLLPSQGTGRLGEELLVRERLVTIVNRDGCNETSCPVAAMVDAPDGLNSRGNTCYGIS